MKITKNKDIDLKTIKCFLCTPAMGKTTLANKYDDYIDLDSLRSKYKYNYSDNFSYQDLEMQKGSPNRQVINTDSDELIKETVLKYIKEDKILLFAPHPFIREFLEEQNIEYALCFYNLDCAETLRLRMSKRGNSPEFIEEMYGEEAAKRYYEANINDKDASVLIELSKGDYLKDIFKTIKEA